MDFIFVRHGESENNVLHEALRRTHGSPHGETLFHQQRCHDPPLTPLGVAQAEAVAQRLRVEYPTMTEVWVSFLSRALGTAAAVHAALPHTRVLVMRDINECGGSYRYCHDKKGYVGEPGVSRRDVSSKYPTFMYYDTSTPTLDDEGWYTGDDKEAPAASHGRAVSLIERVEAYVTQHTTTSSQDPSPQHPLIGVVTHGDFFRVLLKELLESGRLVVDEETRQRIALGKEFKGTGAGAATDAWVKNTSVTHFTVRPTLESLCDAPAQTNKTRRNAGAMDWCACVLADASHLDTLAPIAR
jgi:broad specificity phosphatase PhoE